MSPVKSATVVRRYVQSSLACLYLIVGGFLRVKHRTLLYTISRHFGFEAEPSPQDSQPESLVPMISLLSLLQQNTTLTLSELAYEDGNVTMLEIIVIASLVKQNACDLALEIGTFDGRTTLNMALNMEKGSRIVTLNLPAADIESAHEHIEDTERKYILRGTSGERFLGRETAGRIIQILGDSASYDFSEYKGCVDLIFIDGSHSYEYAMKDTRTALSIMRPGGLIIWHDYDTPHWHGLTRALNELYTQDPVFKNLKHVAGTTLCVLKV